MAKQNEAKQDEQEQAKPAKAKNPELVAVIKNGTVLHVHPRTVDEHLKLGWARVDAQG